MTERDRSARPAGENHGSVDTFTLWRLLFNARNAVGRLREFELASSRVTPEQSQALLLLTSKNGTSNISEMADAWLRQRNSVSTLMDRMAKQGLVKKIKHPGHRELEIRITPRGQAMFNRTSDVRETFDRVFAVLSEEERNQLAQSLKAIVLRSRGLLGASTKLPFEV